MAELTEQEKKRQAALEKAREARIAQFANGADTRPASDNVGGPAIAPSPAPAAAPPAAPEPETLGEPALAVEEAAGSGSEAVAEADASGAPTEAVVSTSSARVRKPARQAAARAPWADAHPRLKVPFTMQLPEEQHMQLTWLKEHMPNTSIQKIVSQAITEKIAKLLREYYE